MEQSLILLLQAFVEVLQVAQTDWRDVPVAAGFGSNLRARLVWATEMTR